MSVKQMAMVWEHQFSKSEQAIMLALTDHAHDDGTHIFPSTARVAWKTDYSTRQTQRIIKDLVSNKILILVQKSRQHRPNEYKIDWTKVKPKGEFSPDKMATLAEPGVTSDAPGVTSTTPRGDTAMSPEPLKNHHIEPSKDSSARKRAPTAHQLAVGELADYFEEITGIPRPDWDTLSAKERKKAGTRWSAPLSRMYKMGEKNLAITTTFMRVAYEKMEDDNLTISAPQSIENVFVAEYGKSRVSKNGRFGETIQETIERRRQLAEKEMNG